MAMCIIAITGASLYLFATYKVEALLDRDRINTKT